MPITLPSAAVRAGTVAHFAAATPPAGWLACTGAAVPRSLYGALFLAIGTTYGAGDGSTTFNLPDLRGEFIRGHDGGRGVDTGRVFGAAQTDAMHNHRHVQTNAGGASGGTHTGNFDTGLGSATGIITTASIYTGPILGTLGPVENGQGAPNVAAETRPRNVAMLACIKF